MTAALALLTVLGRAREPTAACGGWFPIVGAAIGVLVGGVWWASDLSFPPIVAAALAVVADLAVTGMLHFDGLADTADGLLPHAAREERLRIMRTPDVGAFGVVAVAAALLIRVTALSAQPVSIGLIAALWCASRTVAASTPRFSPYARDEGLASAMLPSPASTWLLVALFPAGVVAALTTGLRGSVAVAVTAVGVAGVAALAKRRIGGFTGDVLGAGIVLGETIGLVVAAAKW